MRLGDGAGAADDGGDAGLLVNAALGAIADAAGAVGTGELLGERGEFVLLGQTHAGDVTDDFVGEAAAGVDGLHGGGDMGVDMRLELGEMGVRVIAGNGADFHHEFAQLGDDVEDGAALDGADMQRGVRRVETAVERAFGGETAGFGGHICHGFGGGLHGVHTTTGFAGMAWLAAHGDADGEAAFMGEDGQHEAWFAHDAQRGLEAARADIAHQGVRPFHRCLFIEGDEQVDGLGEFGGHKVWHGSKTAGDEALHVAGTTAIHAAVMLAQGERVRRPRLAIDGHGIDMARECDAACHVRADDGVDVGLGFVRTEAGAVEDAVPVEPLSDKIDQVEIGVPARGVKRHEMAEHFGGSGMGGNNGCDGIHGSTLYARHGTATGATSCRMGSTASGSARMTNKLSPLSLPHRLWRALPAGPRRRALAQATAMLAPRPDRVPPVCRDGMVVAGELSRPSGLGESARLISRALNGMGVPVRGIDVGDGVAFRRGRVELPPPAMPLLLHVNAPMLPLTLLKLPRRLVSGRRVIGYWAWELPTMPPTWQVGLDFVHEIWVLSQFTADAVGQLLPSASRIALRVVPPPVALDPPVASPLTRADFGLPEGAVVTLVSFSLASSFARKNPLAAIAAHKAAFGDRADRILLVKAGHAGAHAEDFDRLREAARGFGNIRFETRMLESADRHALTACADIVLSLHRSEGLGLVPAEAMLLGVPVVATGWSATAEFMDAQSARMVAFRLIPATDPRGVFEAPGAVWAEADVEDAARHLRELADDADVRRRVGEAGRQMAMARLGDAALREAVRGLGL